jgi:hypothetical protein
MNRKWFFELDFRGPYQRRDLPFTDIEHGEELTDLISSSIKPAHRVTYPS